MILSRLAESCTRGTSFGGAGAVVALIGERKAARYVRHRKLPKNSISIFERKAARHLGPTAPMMVCLTRCGDSRSRIAV
jgi:hypothetical protein